MYDYNIGSTLKNIRKEKGLTQHDVCTDICSRTFLSKIENNESIPNTFVMANILSNLNISFDEFFFLTHEFQKDKFRYKEKICTTFFSLRDNYEELDDIIFECHTFLNKYSDTFINEILIVSTFLKDIKIKSDCDFDKFDLHLIWERMQKMNILTLNEIKLINCILFYFPKNIAKNIAVFLLNQLKKYNGYSNSSTLIMSIHLNIYTLYFYNKDFKESRKITQKVINYAEKICRFDIIYLSKYRLAMMTDDYKLQEKCYSILMELELKTYIDELEKENIFYKKCRKG